MAAGRTVVPDSWLPLSYLTKAWRGLTVTENLSLDLVQVPPPLAIC